MYPGSKKELSRFDWMHLSPSSKTTAIAIDVDVEPKMSLAPRECEGLRTPIRHQCVCSCIVWLSLVCAFMWKCCACSGDTNYCPVALSGYYMSLHSCRDAMHTSTQQPCVSPVLFALFELVPHLVEIPKILVIVWWLWAKLGNLSSVDNAKMIQVATLVDVHWLCIQLPIFHSYCRHLTVHFCFCSFVTLIAVARLFLLVVALHALLSFWT